MWAVAARLALSPAGKAVGALLLAAAVLGGIYILGRHAGRDAVLTSLANDKVTILKEGRAIDHAADLLDDSGLCAVLGGCGVPGDAGGD